MRILLDEPLAIRRVVDIPIDMGLRGRIRVVTGIWTAPVVSTKIATPTGMYEEHDGAWLPIWLAQ